MLILHCERHGHPMMVGYRRLRDVRDTAAGTEIDWECYCGWKGTYRPERYPNQTRGD